MATPISTITIALFLSLPLSLFSSSQESLGGLATSGWSGGGGASPGLPRGVAAAASAVSIASMHQQKKRGIKSSLGRFFSKKEKAGLPVSLLQLIIVSFYF